MNTKKILAHVGDIRDIAMAQAALVGNGRASASHTVAILTEIAERSSKIVDGHKKVVITEILDEQLETFLDGIIGVVAATRAEQHFLWAENQLRVEPRTWESNLSGLYETVGYIDDMPVCLSLSTAVVGGHKLLFWDATSQCVDHRMIDEWLKVVVPASARRDDDRINNTDATNFYNIFPRE